MINTFVKRILTYSLFAISIIASSFFIINHTLNAQATESLKTEIKFDKEKNSFNVKINTQEKVDYILTYRTDKQNEAVKGTSDEKEKKDFERDFYAGTCSSDENCTPHTVLRGFFKAKVETQNLIT